MRSVSLDLTITSSHAACVGFLITNSLGEFLWFGSLGEWARMASFVCFSVCLGATLLDKWACVLSCVSIFWLAWCAQHICISLFWLQTSARKVLRGTGKYST